MNETTRERASKLALSIYFHRNGMQFRGATRDKSVQVAIHSFSYAVLEGLLSRLSGGATPGDQVVLSRSSMPGFEKRMRRAL